MAGEADRSAEVDPNARAGAGAPGKVSYQVAVAEAELVRVRAENEQTMREIMWAVRSLRVERFRRDGRMIVVGMALGAAVVTGFMLAARRA